MVIPEFSKIGGGWEYGKKKMNKFFHPLNVRFQKRRMHKKGKSYQMLL